MDVKLIYDNISSLLPIVYGVGILNWFIIKGICTLRFKKLVKIKIGNEYKTDMKKVKTFDIIEFMYSLFEEYRFSYLLMLLYFVSGLMAIGSILILFDASKVLYCISYITLPILELIIFKMAKFKLKEKLNNNKVISIKEKKMSSYIVTI